MVFRSMAAILGLFAGFAGFYLVHDPLKGFHLLPALSAFGMALLFLGFTVLHKPAPKGQPVSIWKIGCLIGFFFMLFIALAVYVLLIAGKP